MFRFKRNFSIRDSPVKTLNSPIGKASPIKRIKLSSNFSSPVPSYEKRTLHHERQSILRQPNGLASPLEVPAVRAQINPLLSEPTGNLGKFFDNETRVRTREENQVEISVNDDLNRMNTSSILRIETPPQTPIEKLESRKSVLEHQKFELMKESNELDNTLTTKFNTVKSIREKTIEIKSQQSFVEDLFEVVGWGQCEVRNLLNEMYNPGNELAKRAAILISDVRKSHQKKFEKLLFEIKHHMDTAEEAIRRKADAIKHEKDIRERTLLTLEHQKAMSGGTSNLQQPVITPNEHNDDDCVIIDKSASSLQELDACKNDSPSELTVTCGCESDDEQTDIEESTESGEQRSFTPCQAQRPNYEPENQV